MTIRQLRSFRLPILFALLAASACGRGVTEVGDHSTVPRSSMGGEDPLRTAIREVEDMCPGSQMAAGLLAMYNGGELRMGHIPEGFDGVTTWDTWQGQYVGGDQITIDPAMTFHPGLPGLLRHEYGHVGGLPHDQNGNTWADSSCGP
jgi:hypothetical protein